jgi:hypothetical protein
MPISKAVGSAPGMPSQKMLTDTNPKSELLGK